ncbi:MAG: hypothetical protein J7545_07070 [Roseofilum sp. SBFL]|uniref:hypothetical protein n=1 Tax=unclassified Roseofilum TaxID=2620099 RepID=UPI001B275990|nr:MULTISPECIES: hypothetical protein [unclassified Roseofilum]MBP0015511.1 hypothetical protein [Roseofilum sp. SID3]MBP0023390.1 hypothetical protein [Roseofilum sp. SID2]MBP0036645.1 hypothetical protein [Roseofilum sp. SID1]MBP0041720.1 hypothetical protein [Roseofilum sp. SBFL]
MALSPLPQRYQGYLFNSGTGELWRIDPKIPAGVNRPTLLNFCKPVTRQAFTAPNFAYWLRPSSEI